MHEARNVAIGCMRLSTDPDRDDHRSIEALHAAFDAGVTLRPADEELASLRKQDVAAGPPRCWCRKPLPGLGVLLIDRHRLDPTRCAYIGNGPADPSFARKLGFAYRRHNSSR